jgi:SNF2 family DNA or RNA helicase
VEIVLGLLALISYITTPSFANTRESRFMSDTFMGRPIVDLPAPTEQNLKIRFDAEEEVLYKAFEQRLAKSSLDQLEKGDERRNLKCLLVRLTRLRQFVAHPILVEKQLKVCSIAQCSKYLHPHMLF